MAADPPLSELVASPLALIERAWHLLTVLIRIGRPVPPAELASRCALSPSLSPELVKLLCRIPGSPLLLTDGHFVTVSNSALPALARFVSAAISPFVPRCSIRAAAQRVSADFSLMYARKRKSRPSEDSSVVPLAKRRILIDSDTCAENSRRNACQQLPTSHWKYRVPRMVMSTDDALKEAMRNSLITSNQENALTVSLHNPSAMLPNIGNFEFAEGTNEAEKRCDDAQAIIMYKEFPDLITVNGVDASRAITTERLKASEVGIEPVLVCNPVLQNESWRTEEELKIAASLVGRDEMMSTLPFVLDSNEEWNATPTETCTLDIRATGYRNSDEHVSAKKVDKFVCRDQIGSGFAFTATPFVAEPTIVRKENRKPSEKPKVMAALALTLGSQSQNNDVNKRRDVGSPKHEQAKRDEKYTSGKQKMKKSHNQNMPTKENLVDDNPKATKGDSEPKLLPNFESFIVEEEEGSGGYGIVYRARRKEDGKIFAIKCPHANAHSHHINNELRMLERFGGRNFVIKYEGSFKNDGLKCFVLEHVEHDRPENLKKEIDICGLQWYGYCMFKALASLHKQGIVHRDVKPGNFLFSRNLNKGYLVDFNLANDLAQKFCRSSKSQRRPNVNLDLLPLPSTKSQSNATAIRPRNAGTSDSFRKKASHDPRKSLLSKTMKKSNTFCGDADIRNKYANQGADGSGITSTKDPTSTKTPSADRLMEPVLYMGRKALMNFMHEEMQSPGCQVATAPISQRKRVAAPLEKLARGAVILTPMPLHSGGNAVAGAGMFNTQGNGKKKREGPCVGTKGFRAPEVLFRSHHQGCKVDTWSAGVTLLYFIIGRLPFTGDPEQNIKEIAKLKGSEDLWEVAKIHNCESLFPSNLFDVLSLPSVELRHWCVKNTKRPELLDLIPQSLFDLLDKCLMVNPRCRIAAEEALMHEFFAPCHESLRKQRTQRRAAGSEPGIHSPF